MGWIQSGDTVDKRDCDSVGFRILFGENDIDILLSIEMHHLRKIFSTHGGMKL